jgi:hypothetical protein
MVESEIEESLIGCSMLNLRPRPRDAGQARQCSGSESMYISIFTTPLYLITLLQHINATYQRQQHKMALPLPPGLTPSEVGFLAEMELVTVIPRQRLESLELLGVSSRRPA